MCGVGAEKDVVPSISRGERRRDRAIATAAEGGLPLHARERPDEEDDDAAADRVIILESDWIGMLAATFAPFLRRKRRARESRRDSCESRVMPWDVSKRPYLGLQRKPGHVKAKQKKPFPICLNQK